MLPSHLYHYYETTRSPFLSISELSAEEFADMMDGFANLNTSQNRFDEQWKREFYHAFRPYVEKVIRKRFIEKGGKPQLQAPRYMTLGPTSWFLDWYENPAMIEIPLDSFPQHSISFTYPDSMMSYLIAEERHEPFIKYKQPYHGEVFTLSEIRQVIAQYGFPDETDAANIEHGNRIIEAQIWDLEPLHDYIGKYSR